LSYSKKKKAASRREGGQTEQDTRKRDKVSDQTELRKEIMSKLVVDLLQQKGLGC
jgi:hypothetical protein